MLNWLKNFQLEKISYFLGFFSALIFWFIFTKLRIWYPDVKKVIKRYLSKSKSQRTSEIQKAIEHQAYFRAQSTHIAKSLFALEDNIVEPLFLAELPISGDEDKSIFENQITTTIPFLPDFPHLVRNFNVSRINIIEACQKSADLVICGMPGFGKSIALAHLVTCMIKKRSETGILAEKIPVFFDVHETPIFSQPNLPLVEMLVKVLSTKLSSSFQPKIAAYLKEKFSENKAILIIDSLDELPPTQFDLFVDYIKKIKQEYPDLQIIVTSSTLYFGDLLRLNFSPLFLSAWSNSQIIDFYSNWNRLWKKDISNNISQDLNEFENLLIHNWASDNLKPLTPLEHTLHIWNALSGDLWGAGISDLYQKFVKRILNQKPLRELASTLALDLIENQNYQISSDQKDDALSKLMQSDIIRLFDNGKFTFIHSELVGYLASESDHLEPIREVKGINLQWPANFSYLGFRSSNDPESEWIYPLISNENSIIPSGLFSIHHWLKLSTKTLNWKNLFIKKLVQIIQNEQVTFPIKIRAIGALVLSNDASLVVFFKQLLTHKNDSFKELALFGISASNRDKSLVPELVSLSQTTTKFLQKIVCLALSTYDTEEAIHELGRVLLNGDESVRKIVAESLAFNPSYGTEILKEATTMEDIVVRRSSINGLVKLKSDWAIQTLRDFMIQDSQWVVRNAAAQALEFLESEDCLIPEKRIPLVENSWVIEFAGRQNLGVSPVQAVTPILSLALDSPSITDISQAIKSSTQEFDEVTISKMTQIMSSSQDRFLLNQILVTLMLIKNSRSKSHN